MAFKIIKDSHLDHGLTEAQVEYIKKRFAERDSFFIETVELPMELGDVPCALLGPVTGGDPVSEGDVVYLVRDKRQCASRVHKQSEGVLCKERNLEALGDMSHFEWDKRMAEVRAESVKMPRTQLVTIIAGPTVECPSGNGCTGATCANYDAHIEHDCVLYTSYGGPLAPREPGDSTIASWEELVASRAFWKQHALILVE